jgi:hypothetical protein
MKSDQLISLVLKIVRQTDGRDKGLKGECEQLVQLMGPHIECRLDGSPL